MPAKRLHQKRLTYVSSQVGKMEISVERKAITKRLFFSAMLPFEVIRFLGFSSTRMILIRQIHGKNGGSQVHRHQRPIQQTGLQVIKV
jgi:hypothetical protein